MHEKTKRLLESSDHYLDSYPWEQNHPPPLDKRAIAHFQKRINKICGLAPSGVPNVRIIWPADTDESISMHIVDGEPRARYGVYSYEYQCERQADGVTAVEMITVDITPQRWIVEEFNEPTNSYSHLFTVGHHDERCCDGVESIGGHLCYGLYREPEQRDLEYLQRMVQVREQYWRARPDEPMSYGEMQDWLSRLRAWKQKAEQATRERYKQAIVSALTPQIPRLFSEDPTVHAHGRYHFIRPGGGHSKSGATKEEIAKWRADKMV